MILFIFKINTVVGSKLLCETPASRLHTCEKLSRRTVKE